MPARCREPDAEISTSTQGTVVLEAMHLVVLGFVMALVPRRDR